jgi:hypothetical protein
MKLVDIDLSKELERPRAELTLSGLGNQLGPSPMSNDRAVAIRHPPCRKPLSDYIAKKK